MRKLMLVAAMLAVVVVAAVPAIAQVSQELSERRIQSGPASPKVEIKNSGDNVNECGPIQQIANTGNVANEQGVVQYFSTADDLDFTGSSITIGTESSPASVTATCDQTINQAAAAG